MGVGGREFLWLGKLRQVSKKTSVGTVPVMCYCDLGGMGRFGAEGSLGESKNLWML